MRDASTDCKKCESGSYSIGQSGPSKCEECSFGKYLCDPNNGIWPACDAKSCVSCPSGYYNERELQDRCIECPSGKFIKKTAMGTELRECKSCGAGFFSKNLTASTACEECPNGKIAATGKSECIECNPKEFSDVDENSVMLVDFFNETRAWPPKCKGCKDLQRT